MYFFTHSVNFDIFLSNIVNVSLLRTSPITNIRHLEAVAPALSGVLFDVAFPEAYQRAYAFSLNDIGCEFRNGALACLNNLITPMGPISLLSGNDRRPKGTTWLELPSRIGVEQVTVGCVKDNGGNIFRLSNSKSYASIYTQPSMMEVPSVITDTMLALRWHVVNPLRSVGELPIIHVEADLLGGLLKHDERLFFAHDIIHLGSGRYGHGGPGEVVVSGPTGPKPTLTRS